MSRADAIRDGVKVERINGRLIYSIPCIRCGSIYRRRQYTGKQECICPVCREILHKKEQAYVEELALSMPDVETKEERRYRKAVEQIEKQYTLKGYSKAIEICRKAVYKFGSIPEVLLAIELIRKGYAIIPQQKIGQYRVDFALPKEKVIIEVDGSPFHSDKKKELEREASINFAIGLDWKVIHIPAEAISDDVQKVVRYLKMRDAGDNNICFT